MQVQPYLFFDGRCDEALAFYKKAMGAQVEGLMRWKDCPEPAQPGMTPPSPEKIMHARLKIGVAADLMETRARFAKGTKWVRNTSLSPSGARVAMEFRGEILTVPAEKGDDRNITQSVAAHDRSPAWSPDGKSIAWFSDDGGEYQLMIGAQDGKGTPRELKSHVEVAVALR